VGLLILAPPFALQSIADKAAYLPVSRMAFSKSPFRARIYTVELRTP